MQVFTPSDVITQVQADTLNARYQEACKDLLSEVQQYPVGTEVSIVYDENMNPIKGCGYIVGGIGSVKIENPNVPYHAFHNHASGQTFSPEDLSIMSSKENQLSLSAVGNNSVMYSMVKTDKADSVAYNIFLAEKMQNELIFYDYSYLDIKNKKLDISKLSYKQLQELKEAIIRFGVECSKAGERYGYKYIYK